MKICPCCLRNFNKTNEVHKCFMTEDDVLFYKCIVCSSVMSARLTLNLEVDYMADKKSEAPKPTVWESKAVVCQCCRFHSNNPSTCNAYKKSVGRKQDATDCKKYKRRN